MEKTSDRRCVSFQKLAPLPGLKMEVQRLSSISKPPPLIRQNPTLKWAQREDSLLMTIELPNAKDVKLLLEPKGRFCFAATRGTENMLYEIDINLYDKVNVNESKASIGSRNIVYLVRKEQQKWWSRLLKKEGRTPSFIEIDLDRWEDVEEQGEPDAAYQIVKGQEFEKKAEKKLSGWGIFGSKHEDACELYEKAANCYKLAKSWNQAGAVYVKLAECFLKGSNSKHEAANAYADAGHAYKKTNTEECIACLEEALDLFMEIGKLGVSARYCKESAELYENEQDLQAISYYDIAVDLFQGEEVTTSYRCKQKIAQFLAPGGQYHKAREIYEEIARQSLNNNLLKHTVRGHLLNAGICQLCEDDIVAMTNALERYQELDPTFLGSGEHRLLADLAAALDERDYLSFRNAVKVSGMAERDEWKKTLMCKEHICDFMVGFWNNQQGWISGYYPCLWSQRLKVLSSCLARPEVIFYL